MCGRTIANLSNTTRKKNISCCSDAGFCMIAYGGTKSKLLQDRLVVARGLTLRKQVLSTRRFLFAEKLKLKFDYLFS